MFVVNWQLAKRPLYVTNTSIKQSQLKLLLFHHQNTDRIQQVAKMSPWKRLNIICMFPKLVFDRVDNSFECFNWATHHYGLCQPDPVKYHAKERRFLSLSRLTRKNNERRGMLCRNCLKGGLSLSLYVIAIFSLAISYISSIYFGVKC